MKYMLRVAFHAALTCAFSSLVWAGCVGRSVNAFGAKGDGHTDDTAAIQKAINAVAASGGGSVVFNVARYYTTGTFVVPNSVVLCGVIEGPFDVPGVDPAVTAIAPTLLVTNTKSPFVTLSGIGSGVTDLLFHYPNQVKTSATTPKAYPFTIQIAQAGTKVSRSTVTNAYNFLDIEVGRSMAQDLFIGAFKYGIYIDHTQDHVTLRNLHHTVFWDVLENAPFPTTIDTWVLNHGYALVVNRMDSLEINDFFVYARFAGMLLTDSPDKSQIPTCGYGTGSDIDLDTVQYGIIESASNSPGYKFTSVDVGTPNPGQAVAWLPPGGSIAPTLEINGGSERGTWKKGPFPAPASGSLIVLNVIGYNAN